MTDDSDAARRGDDPLSEDADATAEVAHHPTVADADATAQVVHHPTVADAAVPHQSADPADTEGPQYDAGPRYHAQYGGVSNPTPPASGPERADASHQQYSYGPFHRGAQRYDAYPSLGAWSTGSAPGADPAQGAGPASGAGPPPDVDARYGPAQAQGPGPAYGATPASGAGPTTSGADPMASGADPIYRPAPVAGGGPTPIPPSWSDTYPLSGTGPAADRYGFDVATSFGGGGPRIEPTPKQPRGRFILPALAGLLVGFVLFGTGGWLLGRATTDDPKPAKATAQAGPSAVPPGAYEQNQIAINRPKLSGTLATVSQGWLPYLSGCSRSGDKGGPTLNQGEKTRVRCEMDAMSVIFVEYGSTADRDKARVATLGQNVDARKLAPGVGAAVERPTPSGRTSGNYVEYAYQAAGRTVSAIWWDDADTPVAAYLLAFWKEGAGEKWEPMRDVWARYA